MIHLCTNIQHTYIHAWLRVAGETRGQLCITIMSIIISIIDHRRGRAVVNLPGNENYSKLGLCDSDVENNYQLLDKEDPGSKVKK